MRLESIVFCSLVVLVWGCKKNNPASTPPQLQNAAIEIISPADSSFFPKSELITIKAKVTRGEGDLSILRAYVIDNAAGVGDTIVRTTVTEAGDILATLANTLQSGSHRMQILLRNPGNANQMLGSKLFSFFIGQPPYVNITVIEKDDISNTIYWSRSDIPNFKAYEIYASRTDLMPDRPPYPDGELIATINDQDLLSFTHDSIYFYYRYSYMVKVVTDEDESNISERQTIVSGNYIELGNGYSSRYTFFDPQKQRIYSPLGKYMVIDPLELSIIDSVPYPENVQWFGMNNDANSIEMIVAKDHNLYQVASVDINTKQVTSKEEFSFPDGPKSILALIDKTVLYAGNVSSTPFIPVTFAYNIVSGEKKIIRWGNTGNVELLTNNRVLISNYLDSIFVFSYSAGDFTLTKTDNINGINLNSRIAYESNSLLAIGTKLYDQSFNEVHEIDFVGGDHQNYFIGISTDGQYAATNQNEIINTSSKQVERVYGDGFGGSVFFSNDNDVLFHFTGNGLNIRWQPGARLHRYPWR